MTRRQDARRNRDRLLAAGEAVFHAGGLQAPLQQVFEQAGLGRGTLYRHFPDREHLLMAMIERRVDLIEERLAGASDAAHSVRETFEWIADALSAIPGLHASLTATAEGTATLHRLDRRVRAALARPLDAAHREGLLRPGVTLDDLVDSWLMIEGSLLAVPAADRERMARRAKDLLGAALFMAPR